MAESMAKKTLKRKTVKLYNPRLDGLSAEMWLYRAQKSSEVLVQVLQHGKHLVTMSLRVRH